MVDLCSVVKWSAVLECGSENWTEKSLFMVQNVCYYNGPPSHVILSFEYRTTILSCIQVLSSQMVTVFCDLQYGSEI